MLVDAEAHEAFAAGCAVRWLTTRVEHAFALWMAAYGAPVFAILKGCLLTTVTWAVAALFD